MGCYYASEPLEGLNIYFMITKKLDQSGRLAIWNAMTIHINFDSKDVLSSWLYIWFYYILSSSATSNWWLELSLIHKYVSASNSLLNCMNNGSSLRCSSTCTMWRKNLKSYFNNFMSFQRSRILTSFLKSMK